MPRVVHTLRVMLHILTAQCFAGLLGFVWPHEGSTAVPGRPVCVFIWPSTMDGKRMNVGVSCVISFYVYCLSTTNTYTKRALLVHREEDVCVLHVKPF